jgi:hypothetical protein
VQEQEVVMLSVASGQTDRMALTNWLGEHMVELRKTEQNEGKAP